MDPFVPARHWRVDDDRAVFLIISHFVCLLSIDPKIRMEHVSTERNLHTHHVQSPLSLQQVRHEIDPVPAVNRLTAVSSHNPSDQQTACAHHVWFASQNILQEISCFQPREEGDSNDDWTVICTHLVGREVCPVPAARRNKIPQLREPFALSSHVGITCALLCLPFSRRGTKGIKCLCKA